jgi:hypothetical protein
MQDDAVQNRTRQSGHVFSEPHKTRFHGGYVRRLIEDSLLQRRQTRNRLFSQRRWGVHGEALAYIGDPSAQFVNIRPGYGGRTVSSTAHIHLTAGDLPYLER